MNRIFFAVVLNVAYREKCKCLEITVNGNFVIDNFLQIMMIILHKIGESMTLKKEGKSVQFAFNQVI